MYIAIATADNTPTAAIPEYLRKAKYLFIVDAEQNQVVHIVDASAEREADIAFARAAKEWNCEAFISGEIERAPFDILADAQITRYNGYCFNASQVLKQMYTYSLPVMREHRSGGGHQHKEVRSCVHSLPSLRSKV